MTASDKPSVGSIGSATLEAMLLQGKALLVITDPQGRLLWSSKAFDDLAGTLANPGEILTNCFSATAEDRDQVLQQELADGLRKGEFSEVVVALGPRQPTVAGIDPTIWLRLHIASTEGLRLWTMTDIRVERAMRLRLQRLQELLDTAQNFGRLGVWERDIASGIGHWDEHVFRFWGLDPSIGTPSFEVASEQIHPDDRNSTEFAKSTKQPGRYSQRFRVQLADGDLRWLHSQWEVKAGADGTPSHAVGVMVDDSEAIALARSLGETTAKLTLALELGEIVIFQQDLHTRRVHLNARGFEMLGLPFNADGLPIDEVAGLIYPEDHKEVRTTGVRALRDNKPVDMQIRIRQADGQWRHILSRRVVQRDALDRPLSLVGVALDVTDRLKADQALRLAHERIALAAHGAGIGTWEHDLRSDKVRWDKQMYLLRGLTEPNSLDLSKAPAKLRVSLVHPEDVDRIREAKERSLADGPMASYDFRVRWPDGSYRWMASRSIPVRDESGQALRQIGVNWDIHDRVVAEEVRSEAQAAERLSNAKLALLARMSHELRTPLNAILGFTELLEIERSAAVGSAAELTRAAKQGHMLGHIRGAAEKLLDLVDDVLDLSRLSTSELQMSPQPVELSAILADVTASIEQKAFSRSVRLRHSAGGIRVLADPSRLRQILSKLLGHYLSVIPASSEININASTRDNEVRIAIGDHGPGLSDAQQLELFDVFGPLNAGVQAGRDPDFGLFGALLTGMNGRLALADGGERGERFCIWLPLAPLPAVEEPGHVQAEAGPAAAKVLYIEDNPVNVILVDELVAKRGNVEFCSEATGAAGVARALSFLPDLILIDIHLPDFDGFEVLRQLRADSATASICCVALSANAIAEDVARARAAGFDDYWTKPIRFSSFLAGLNRLLANVKPR